MYFLLFLRWLRPFLQLQCSTKPSQETYGLAPIALVTALACLAVLGVLCVARFPFHDSQVFYVGVFSALRAVQDGPRAIPNYFFWLQERPRALQETAKRLSEGFRVEDAIRNPFGTHFWHQKESSGPKQPLKSLQLSVI